MIFGFEGLRFVFLHHQMIEISDILNFLKEQTGSNLVSENCDISNDLGIDGDDFDDLIIEFGKKYNVDISPCIWYFHSAEEGSWNSIGGAFFKSPNNRVQHIPVTPLMLLEFVRAGKWNLQYPDHKIPKRRYDIIINQLLILALIIFMLIKCGF